MSVDFNQLTPPKAVEELDFETIFNEHMIVEKIKIKRRTKKKYPDGSDNISNPISFKVHDCGYYNCLIQSLQIML